MQQLELERPGACVARAPGRVRVVGRWAGSERAEAPIALVILAPILLLASFGLTHDWGGKVRAAEEAVAVAEQAARAGVDAGTQAGAAKSGRVRLDRYQAERAARRFIERAGVQGTVTTGADRVAVEVTVDYEPKFLPVGTLHGRGSGEATTYTSDARDKSRQGTP